MSDLAAYPPQPVYKDRGTGGVNSRSMLGGGVVYLLAGTYFAVLGVGTLRGRRWARTI